MATTTTRKSRSAARRRRVRQAVTRDTVAARLERLRRLAEIDRDAAQAEAWAWFAEAGQRVAAGGQQREDALVELGELFAAGTPARIDGPTEGMLVSFTAKPGLDRIMAAITTVWLPWAGKTFDEASARGGNLLRRSARLPARLIWPMYRFGTTSKHVTAFEFETRVEPGALDPGTEVLVIDYASIQSNPSLLIKSIRDELVEVVPGAHLGKMLWVHSGGERHSFLAYFALKSGDA